MPEIGRTVSHYTILEKLGAGGMGEVYRAEDLTLKRQVALKVLPSPCTADPERLARLEREARVLASLNHPHIAAIYGFEEAEGERFLVLELVEGETLAERLHRGPLSVQAALQVCRQIADGLDAAHEKGIVHRDLKPANVKITPEGVVKVLDFGLAKAVCLTADMADTDGRVLSLGSDDAPTATADMTRAGMVLGTAAYMSPEQSTGRALDKRTDIWAFGCVLYECLTAKRAFAADTVTETLAAVLTGDPDWAALPARTPSKLKDLLRRCLAKDPRARLRDIGDARIEIADVLTSPDAGAGEVRTPRPAWRWLVVTLVLAAGAALGVLAGRSLTRPSAPAVVRTTVLLPAGTQLTREARGPSRTEVALAPDGSYLVFSASPNGSGAQAMLYKRLLASAEATPMRGTEGARTPFFSPDGLWIGFWANKKLYKVSANGGIPDAICDGVHMPFGICWGRDGTITFGTEESAGLERVQAAGGAPQSLTRVDPERDASHRLPHLLPGGKALVFTVMPHTWGVAARVEGLWLETRQRKTLVDDAADARYLPTGHLVFVRRGTLMAAPFDPDRLEITGPSVTIAGTILQAFNELFSEWNSGAGQYAVAESGTLVYVSGGIFPDPVIPRNLVDRDGRAQLWRGFGTRPSLGVRLSPDGRRAVYSSTGLNRTLWVYDIERDTATKLTTDGLSTFATWSPDGKRVAFSWSKAGPLNIWWKRSDGSGEMERLTTSDYAQQPASWSRDGQYLALVEENPSTGSDILIRRMADGEVTRFISTAAAEQWPEFSPDGRWLAYASDESGRNEIYLRAFPGGDKRQTVTSQGGIAPLWSPDGRELFYWNLDRTALMKVDIFPGREAPAGIPKLLFKFATTYSGPVRGYDITPDGRRFLVPEPPRYTPTEVTQLNLVQNWFEEVRRLSPAVK
jgi:Tol biopolymer transport system component